VSNNSEVLHTCWHTDKVCPHCGKNLATNGRILWCEKHCEYIEKSDQEMK